jgi:hypothetical protein
MNCFFYKNLFCLLLLTFYGGCKAVSSNSTPSLPLLTPTPFVSSSQTAEEPNFKPKHLEDFDISADSLSYKDYRIEKYAKPTIVEGKKYDNDGHSFGILKKKGKIIAKFDGLEHPLGTEIRFGLFPLFSPNSNLLVVEQTAHRDWRYWVVNLDEKARIIFDSGDYAVGQDLRVLDVDGDGRSELILSLTAFWFFENLNNSNSPFIEIVFSYDSKHRKYILANHKFQKFVLRDIEKQINEVKTRGNLQDENLSVVLKVMLPYLYAGKRQEAWSSYEKWYDLPDKEEMKLKIEKTLKADLLYKTIYY